MAARTHKKKKTEKDPSFRKKKPLGYLPIQRKIALGNPQGPTDTNAQVDYARLASQVNHRLYRYGKMYSLKVDIDPHIFNPGTQLHVYALMNTWYVQKAFEEAKTVYERAYIDEKENISEAAYARWRDFRIQSGLTSQFLQAQVDDTPESATSTGVSAGEFDDSIVVDATGTTRTFTWATSTVPATAYSVVNEYDLAGNTNFSPTFPTGAGPYDDLEADASPVEMEALQDRGNRPPYASSAFPSVWMKVATLTVGANGNQKLSTGYFDAPCGILSLRAQGQTWGDFSNDVYVTAQAGDYKGVKAHNMERM